jgi:hypothetical protein
MNRLLKKLPVSELRFLYACFKTLLELRSEIRTEERLISLKLHFLEEITHIKLSSERNLWNLNPTITQTGKLEIYYRKTTGALFPEAKLNGISRIDNPSKDFKNAVMRLELADDMSMTKQETVIDLKGSPCLEDVRAITFQDRTLLIGTLVLTSSPNPWSSTVAIYDTLTKRTLQLKSPNNRRIEKNWVPIEINGKILRLLYSSSPTHIIEVDLINGEQKSSILDNTKISKKPLNGGSQFITLNDGSYLRVARKRFSVIGMGRIHLNYFVHHDINLMEIGRSRPFIFRTLGFEICNGMRLEKSGVIYVTWAENDRDMFIACCRTQNILDFISTNRNKNRPSFLNTIFLLKN